MKRLCLNTDLRSYVSVADDSFHGAKVLAFGDLHLADRFSTCQTLIPKCLQGNVEVGEQLLRLGADPNGEVKASLITHRSLSLHSQHLMQICESLPIPLCLRNPQALMQRETWFPQCKIH